MINFIICDDDKKYMTFMNDIITKYMMKNKMEYKVHKFTDYDKKFLEVVEKKMPFKVYVLDIETPTRSGIDIARIIRNKDVDSVIIFLTGHQELGEVVLKNEFLFLSFINKFDNCAERLYASIDKALKILKARKTIRFKDSGVVYTIALNDILYITKDSIARKSIIKTDYAEFRLNKSLKEITDMLDGNFIQTHRACIVNRSRVANHSKAKKVIMFDTGETIDLISNKFNWELI